MSKIYILNGDFIFVYVLLPILDNKQYKINDIYKLCIPIILKLNVVWILIHNSDNNMFFVLCHGK